MIKTKKEAKEKGYHTVEEWLRKDRVVIQINDGVSVKGSVYYDIDATERLISKLHKPGYKVREDAEPIKEKRAYHGYYFDLYRESDFIPIQKRKEIEPQPIDILAAIFTVNRASKRYRDAAESHYGNKQHGLARHSKELKNYLYCLKDKGIKYAYTNGLISCDGKQGGLYIYTGSGYIFHSPIYPRGIEVEAITAEDDIWVDAKPKTEKYRLKDAIYTLEQLDITGLNQLFYRETFEAPGKEYQPSQRWNGEDDWDDNEDWDNYDDF